MFTSLGLLPTILSPWTPKWNRQEKDRKVQTKRSGHQAADYLTLKSCSLALGSVWLVSFSRQGLMYPRRASNSPCKLRMTLNFWSCCLHLLNAGIIGVRHHIQFMQYWNPCSPSILPTELHAQTLALNSYKILLNLEIILLYGFNNLCCKNY